MDIDEILELKKRQDAELAALASKYKVQLIDKSIPLDDRWNLFRKLSKIDGVLDDLNWICHSIDDLGLEWYDDFYVEKYQKVYYSDIYDRMLEIYDISQEAADTWREQILVAGNRSFNYDW